MSSQPLQALTTANTAKAAHTALRHRIANIDGRDNALRHIAELLTSPFDPTLNALELPSLLLAAERIGPGHVDRYLNAAQIYGDGTLGSLTYGQRCALAAVLRYHANSR